MKGTSDPRNQLGRVFIDRHYRQKINAGRADGSSKTLHANDVLKLDWNKAEEYRSVR
jgi:hypothetical protein